MRIFAFIFSFYILALALVPCTDQAGCEYATEQADHHTSGSDHHHHDEESQDHCTPFCVCTCCSQAFNEMTNFISAPELQDDISSECPVYISLFNSEPVFNIWQPPKIS